MNGYVRISDTDAVCPVCGKRDWCLLREDGRATICPRTESPWRAGEAGWWHPVEGVPPPPKPLPEQQLETPNWPVLQRLFQERITPRQIYRLSQQLGVTVWSLRQLGIGWTGDAYSFPIYDAGRGIIGVQRRYLDGAKRTMRGSKITGVHWPEDLEYGSDLYITEGASDLAAVLDCRLCGLARLSCFCGTAVAVSVCCGLRTCVISDRGNVFERRGAAKLVEALRQVCPKVALYLPRGKDVREEVRKYGRTETRKRLLKVWESR